MAQVPGNDAALGVPMTESFRAGEVAVIDAMGRVMSTGVSMAVFRSRVESYNN